MSAEVASEGLGGRLVKLGRILGLAEGPPGIEEDLPSTERETDGGRASREVERRRALYEHYGFSPLPTKPNRLFLPVDSIAALLGKTR